VSEGAKTPAELRAYFGAVDSALNALERRLVARGNLTGDDALAEIRRYRSVVRENLRSLDGIADAPAAPAPPRADP
jgi:hypothetical protein